MIETQNGTKCHMAKQVTKQNHEVNQICSSIV